MSGYLSHLPLPPVKFSRAVLSRRSRDHRLLLRVASGIGLVSLVAGFLVSHFTASGSWAPFFDAVRGVHRLPAIPDLPDPEKATFADWLQAIRGLDLIDRQTAEEESPAPRVPVMPAPPEDLAPAPPDFASELSRLETALIGSALPEPERQLLLALLHGLLGTEKAEREAATRELRSMANATPPRRRAAEFLGDVLERAGDAGGAIDAYRTEVDRFPAESPRSLHRLATLLRQEERLTDLEQLMQRPDLRQQFPIRDHIDLAIDRRDYAALAKWTLLHDLQFHDPWLAVLSLFAAVVWLIIVTQFAGWDRQRLSLYTLAVGLGWLSATLTLYAVFIQSEIRGFDFDESDDAVQQILYFVAGVGLREETLKLLCFLPLVPYLARRAGENDALVCAGLVGLGFALNENIGYVDRGGEFTAWSRFLTANFAHIAWTGIAGLALYRLWRRPRRSWDHFLHDFLIVVAAHGAYDAFIAVPALGDYSFLSLVIFAASAYWFLDHAADQQSGSGAMTVSPIAVFVIGGALLIGVTFCYACWAVPFSIAMAEYVRSLAGVVPVAFIFINRFRHC